MSPLYRRRETFDLERALIHSVNDMEPQYTIEETAQRTGVTAHTLRYYERIGLLEPVGRASSGHRRYNDADLASVGFLTLLRQTGMPIREMQRFVELTRAGDQTIPERVVALEAHRDALAAQIALLDQHFAAITRKINVYRALLAEHEHEQVEEYA
jgi:DNA-binding transcriptional MerR regulator